MIIVITSGHWPAVSQICFYEHVSRTAKMNIRNYYIAGLQVDRRLLYAENIFFPEKKKRTFIIREKQHEL